MIISATTIRLVNRVIRSEMVHHTLVYFYVAGTAVAGIAVAGTAVAGMTTARTPAAGMTGRTVRSHHLG
jgi:hypothetical protein